MSFAKKYASSKLGVLDYKGTWDANSNTPQLVDSVGDKGDYYVVSVAGNTNLNGETDWQPGDWVLFSGTDWQKVDNSQYDTTQQVTLYENNAAIYADAYPGIPDPSFRDGWYFKNTAIGQKINWYFFDGTAENISLGDFSCYAVVTFDSVQDKPFFGIYTIRSGAGDAGSWYRSRIVPVPVNTAIPGVKYLMYFGKEPKVHASLPRLPMTLSSSTVGPQDPTERILTVSLGSNSAASIGACNFIVETLGLNSTSIKRELNLKIRKANQSDLSVETLERTQSIESLQVSLDTESQRAQVAEYNLQLLAEEAKDRSFHTGVQLSSTISDFVESVHSSVTSLFGEGTDISFIYPDENGKIQALLNPTGVTAGSYNTFTVDSRGRIIAASNTESGNAGLDVQITSQTNSTTLTSFSDIVGLESSTLLPGLYRFTFMALANSTSTSTGVGVKLASNTASISTIYGKYAITQSVPGTTQSYEYDQISQNTNVTSTSSVSTYFGFVIQGEGVVRVLSSGTLVMKFRSEVNDSAVSINPDAILRLEKL
jgi:hypothetical protein